MTTPNILVSGSSSIMSSTERPESYQPHHSSLHLSSSSALSTSATTGNLAKEEEGGIVPAHSTSTNTDPPPTTTKKRKQALVTACLALPVAFYAVYGVVASTQDLIWLLRGDSTNDRQKDGVMTTSSSATGPGTSFSGRSDMFDGSITAETPAEHDASAQRPSNPLWSLLTAATFQQPSDGATLGLGSYLTNVVSPHSRYDPHSHLPVMWTPGAPNYGFVVTKMQRCLDVVQASWLGRTTEEEATYWDDIKVVDGNEEDRGRYLNIDMNSLHGIKRAKGECRANIMHARDVKDGTCSCKRSHVCIAHHLCFCVQLVSSWGHLLYFVQTRTWLIVAWPISSSVPTFPRYWIYSPLRRAVVILA